LVLCFVVALQVAFIRNHRNTTVHVPNTKAESHKPPKVMAWHIRQEQTQTANSKQQTEEEKHTTHKPQFQSRPSEGRRCLKRTPTSHKHKSTRDIAKTKTQDPPRGAEIRNKKPAHWRTMTWRCCSLLTHPQATIIFFNKSNSQVQRTKLTLQCTAACHLGHVTAIGRGRSMYGHKAAFEPDRNRNSPDRNTTQKKQKKNTLEL
jgi:hypothetical protein